MSFIVIIHQPTQSTDEFCYFNKSSRQFCTAISVPDAIAKAKIRARKDIIEPWASNTWVANYSCNLQYMRWIKNIADSFMQQEKSKQDTELEKNYP